MFAKAEVAWLKLLKSFFLIQHTMVHQCDDLLETEDDLTGV